MKMGEGFYSLAPFLCSFCFLWSVSFLLLSPATITPPPLWTLALWRQKLQYNFFYKLLSTMLLYYNNEKVIKYRWISYNLLKHPSSTTDHSFYLQLFSDKVNSHFYLLFIYCVWVYMYTGYGACVQIRRQLAGAGSLLLSCGWWGLNLSHQA